MATIKLANFIVAVRGKIAGTVYSQNAGGTFARQYVKPTNPQTMRQTLQRALLVFIAEQWRNLADNARLAWAAAAPEFKYQNRVGDPKILTGQQLYVKLNLAILSADSAGTILSIPPLKPDFGVYEITNLVVTRLLGVLTAEYILSQVVAGDPIAGFYQITRATPGVSAGVMRPSSVAFRVIEKGTAAAAVLNIAGSYDDQFDVPAVGQKVFVRVALVHKASGMVINIGQADVIVTGT